MEQWVVMAFSVTSIAFVAVVIWALLEIRRIMTEAQQTLTTVKGHLVLLIQEMRETTDQADGLIREMREAFDGASTLGYALGDVGQSIQRVQNFIREKGGWIARLLERVLPGTAGLFHAGTNGSERESHLMQRRSTDD